MDLNADVGEGCGDDAALIPLLTSASIACGAHAGDTASMRGAVQAAIDNGVSIGAHVSYPDREHFGRRDLRLPPATVTAAVLEQLRTLEAVVRTAGARIRYVKAHGALYNRMADDVGMAGAVIAAMQTFDAAMALLTLPDSAAMALADSRGMKVFGEAFADRAYTAGAKLVPRSQPGAVIVDADTVAQRAVALATTGKLASQEGTEISIHASSLCVHGDTPGAVTLARAVRQALVLAGVSLGAFL